MSKRLETDPLPADPGATPGPKIAVVIPARDEELALPLVFRDLPDHLRRNVVVVDNGSTDRTATVARSLGARVLAEPQRGYGRACLKALTHLEEIRPDYVVFLDADHSDHPEEIPELLAPLLRDEADLVIGSRTRGRRQKGALPFHAMMGNRVATFLIWILVGFRYSDLGPLRAIVYQKLVGLQMRDAGFGWTVEMQVKAVKKGLRIREVPVSYRPRVGSSKVSGTVTGSLGAGAKIIWTIFRLSLFQS